jgi:hypothetical protein
MRIEKRVVMIAKEPPAQDIISGGMASVPTAHAAIQVAPADFRSGPVQSVSTPDVPATVQVTKTESKS